MESTEERLQDEQQSVVPTEEGEPQRLGSAILVNPHVPREEQSDQGWESQEEELEAAQGELVWDLGPPEDKIHRHSSAPLRSQ
jgi:hypothetical protein